MRKVGQLPGRVGDPEGLVPFGVERSLAVADHVQGLVACVADVPVDGVGDHAQAAGLGVLGLVLPPPLAQVGCDDQVEEQVEGVEATVAFAGGATLSLALLTFVVTAL